MALGSSLFESFKIESASVSKKYELAGLINKGPCLITAQFEISGTVYPVIIDTGATVSFIPERGNVLSMAPHKIMPANLNVILADDSSTLIDKKVTLPIRPCGSRGKSHHATFYIHNNSDQVLGHAALLGLDHLKLFDLQIYVENGKFKVYYDRKCIGQETETPTDYKAFVKVDTRFEKLKATDTTAAIVKRFKGVFTDIGPEPIRGKPMRIETVHQKPIYCKQRNYNPSEILLMKEHVQGLLSKGIIEPTSSGYAATSRMVPKKSGASRLVVNYIPLNRCTVRDSYSLPQIADIFAAIQGQRYFSALDCAQGFYQILVDKRDRHKTAFSTPIGNFQFVRCPFGARNSPAVFQAEMNRIFADGLYNRCIIYVDDILVFGRTLEEHDNNLKWVLCKCQEFNVKIKLEKCVFASKEVDYLGFTIDGHQIKPLKGKCDALSKIEPPKDRTELRSVIGKLNFYSRFIPHYSKQLEPIRELLRNNKEFRWLPYHQRVLFNVVESLKAAEPQLLCDRTEHKTLEIYILPDSIEVLCLNKEDKLISRASRFLLAAESSYSSVEKQLMALVMGINKFQIWLHPGNFTIRVPNRELEKAINLVHRPPRIDSWLLKLPEGFDTLKFEVKESLQTELAKAMPNHIPEEVYYVDGACKANGKPTCQASWAVCAEFDRDFEQTGLVHESPSNNTAELTAAIKACETAISKGQKSITIVTDSKYLYSAATSWIDDWTKGEWLNHKRRPIVNEKLFKQLRDMKSALQIQWIHVKGHGTNPGNIRADNLAGSALNQQTALICGATRTGLRVQKDNTEISRLKELIADGQRADLTIEDDLIYYIDPGLSGEDSKRIFVPEESRRLMLRLAHDDITTGGHSGIKKTFRKLIQFWWPSMYKEVESYIKSCESCQRFKNHGGLPPGYLQSIPVSQIFEHLHVDMMGPVKRTDRGNSYIITATDAFSKWVFAWPCHNIRTTEIVKFLENYVLSVYGKPQTIVTDRGAQFTSSEWSLWVEKHGISHNLTTPRHPQSNGIDERVNGTLSRILRNYVDHHQTNWDEKLKWAVYSYNTTVHESTGYSPFQIIHGFDPRSPLKNNEAGDPLNMPELMTKRNEIRQSANENNKRAQAKQKLNYDKGHQKAELSVGQLVLVRELFISTEFSKKFHPKWDGPYVVVNILGERDNPKAITIWDSANWSKKTFSINDVKPYIERQRKENPREKEGETAVRLEMRPSDTSDLDADDFDITDLISLNEPPARNSNYSNELHNSMRDNDNSITVIDDRDPDRQLTSSTRRVTISDQPTIYNVPDVSSIRPDENAVPEPSETITNETIVADLSRTSPYVMDIMIDNSTTDPTYQPPRAVVGKANEVGRSSSSQEQQDLSVDGRTIRPRTNRPRAITDSPMPQSRYNLRSTARRSATQDIARNHPEPINRASEVDTSENLLDLSENITTTPALTSDSDTDGDDTLIQL